MTHHRAFSIYMMPDVRGVQQRKLPAYNRHIRSKDCTKDECKCKVANMTELCRHLRDYCPSKNAQADLDILQTFAYFPEIRKVLWPDVPPEWQPKSKRKERGRGDRVLPREPLLPGSKP